MLQYSNGIGKLLLEYQPEYLSDNSSFLACMIAKWDGLLFDIADMVTSTLLREPVVWICMSNS